MASTLHFIPFRFQLFPLISVRSSPPPPPPPPHTHLLFLSDREDSLPFYIYQISNCCLYICQISPNRTPPQPFFYISNFKSSLYICHFSPCQIPARHFISVRVHVSPLYLSFTIAVPNRTTFEYSYSVSSIRTNRATVFFAAIFVNKHASLRIRLLLHKI